MTDQHIPARQVSAAAVDAGVPDSARPSRSRAPKPAAKGARPAAKAGAVDAAAVPSVADEAVAPSHEDDAVVASAETAAVSDGRVPGSEPDDAASAVVDDDAGDAAGSAEDALAAAVGEAGDEPGVEVGEIGAAAPAAADDEEEDEEEEEAPRSGARMPGMGGGMARPGMRPISPQLGGRPTPAPRIPSKAENFVEGDHVVYPTHGVGRVERIATEEIAGHKLELIHITFEENRMTLRVPVSKARSAGLRKLATRKMFDEALAVLRGRARIKRTMWSRRAQEYEAKINSGDPMSIAEVVRDLHRNAGQPDQSFSERQIYEAAMDRLAAELAALDQTEKTVAATKLVDYLKTV
ncbi:MAG: CarD family transcriptional regulator [Janthinobacterium lividum]